jgi:hypothetical protein
MEEDLDELHIEGVFRVPWSRKAQFPRVALVGDRGP